MGKIQLGAANAGALHVERRALVGGARSAEGHGGSEDLLERQAGGREAGIVQLILDDRRWSSHVADVIVVTTSFLQGGFKRDGLF